MPPISKSDFLKNLVVVFFLFGILIFYLWTVSTTFKAPFEFVFSPKLGQLDACRNSLSRFDLYNALSDALLAGQLHLLIEPSKGILNLPDPYYDNRPAGLEPDIIPDVSLYKGRYYSYFGISPAITLFIPIRLIFKIYIPQNLAAAIFGFGGVVFSVLLLRFLVKRFFPATPFWMIFISVVGLTLCNVVPFSLRRPGVNEVAVLAAYFFSFGGLYWLVSGFYKEPSSDWKLALGSSFLGLAVGSRPFCALYGLFLIYLAISTYKTTPSRFRQMKMVLNILGPFILFLIVLAFYNYARFQNIFEFGINYLLFNRRSINWYLFNWPYLLPNLFFFLFQPFKIKLYFPFFFLSLPYWPWTLPIGYAKLEEVAGVMTFLPFIWLVIFCLLFYKKLFPVDWKLKTLILFFLIMAVGHLFFISLVTVVLERYVIDFVPLLVISSFLLWYNLFEKLQGLKICRLFLNLFIVASILFGCLFNIFISFTGAYDYLRGIRPDIYCSLASFFPRCKFKKIRAEKIELKIILPQMNPDQMVPLLVKEPGNNQAVFFVHQLKENNFYSIVTITSNKFKSISKPFKINPGQVCNLKIFWGNSLQLVPLKLWNINFCFISINGREISGGQLIGPTIKAPLIMSEQFPGRVLSFKVIPQSD